MTFGEYRDRVERAAAGLARRLRHRRRRRGHLAAAHLVRVDGPGRRHLAGSARRRTRCCRSTASARSASASARPRSKLLVVPSDFANFDFVAMADVDRGRRRRRRGHDLGPLAARRRPGDAARAAGARATTCAGSSTRRAPPPTQGRPPHRRHHPRRRLGHESAPGRSPTPTATRWPSRSPTSAASPGSSRACMTGMVNILFEAFVPDLVVKVLSEQGVTMAGSGTAFHQAYLAAQRASDTPIFPKVRRFPGGGAPKPVPLLLRGEGGVRRAASCRATASPRRPILTMGSVDDRDEDLANTEGAPMPGVELKLVKLDGTVAAVGRGGRDPGQGAPAHARATSTPRSTPTAFDEEGYFRTGDLGRPQRAQHAGDHRAPEGHHHPQGREHQRQGGRGPPLHPPQGARRGGHRPARPRARRAGVRGGVHPRGRRSARLRRDGRVPEGRGADGAEDPRAARDRRRRARATPPARSSSTSCARPTAADAGPVRPRAEAFPRI